MPVCNIATAQSLFKAFESRNIPWTNMIFLLKQPKLFSVGCLCHLGATAALKKLPVSLDELLIDIFYEEVV